jgi:hypothetical protein
MSALLLCIAQVLAVSSGNAQQAPGNPIYIQPSIGTPYVDVPHTISYQGLINLPDGSVPLDGTYPITVSLYADDSAAITIWSGNYTTTISRGIFNIILGSGNDTLPAPSMMNRPIWVGVSFNGNAVAQPLSPLSASPYALNVRDQSISAAKISANYVGSISVNGKTITGSGSNLNIVANNGVQMTFDSATSTLNVNSGAAGTKGGMQILWIGHNLGGTNADGELNTTADSSNVIGGGGSNTANPYGPSGGTNGYASILGGENNTAGSSTQYDAVGGGYMNKAIGGWSVASGGNRNNASGAESSVGGGFKNTTFTSYSTVAGGNSNETSGSGAAISGGEENQANGVNSAIAGGSRLTVGASSFGFNNVSTTGSQTDVSGLPNPLAYFGNVDIHIGNTDGTNRSLVFWGPNTTLAPSSLPISTSITAGSPTASVSYTLPLAAPTGTGQFLTSTTSGGMSWATPSGGGGAWLLTGNPTTVLGDFLGTELGGTNLLLESVGSEAAYFDGTNNSVVLGDVTTNSTTTYQFAGIGAGENNTVSANYGTVPGGLGLTANNYAEAVVGFYNNSGRWGGGTLPSYLPPPPTQPANTNADYPLFAVGNGVAGPSGGSNAFEVSYNGHATPTQVFGNFVSTSVQPIKGASYNDNALNAWGQVDYTTGSGHPTNDFGTNTAVWTGNTCAVTLNCPAMFAGTIHTASITVTGEQDTCPSEITGVIICQTSQLGSGGADCKPGPITFYVSTYWMPVGGRGVEAIAEPFFYKVAGR